MRIGKILDLIPLLFLFISNYARAETFSRLELFELSGEKNSWIPLEVGSQLKEQAKATFSNLFILATPEELLFLTRAIYKCTDLNKSCETKPLGTSFDFKNRTWKELDVSGLPVGDSDLITVGSKNFVLFAERKTGLTTDLINASIFNIESKNWSKIASPPEPYFEVNQLLSLPEDQFFIWGTSKYPNSAALIYNVLSKSWETVDTKKAPSAAWTTMSGWTGSTLVLWGSRSEFGCLSSGGQYVPNEDRWTPIPSSDAPPACDGSFISWAGGKMLVWGGQLSDSRNVVSLDSGAVYDPAKNSWEAMNEEGAPSFETLRDRKNGYMGVTLIDGPVFHRAIANKCEGYKYSLLKKKWEKFSSPLLTKPNGFNYSAFGIDNSHQEMELYEVSPGSDNPDCYIFPPPPEPAHKSTVFRSSQEEMRKLGGKYFFSRIVTENSPN